MKSDKRENSDYLIAKRSEFSFDIFDRYVAGICLFGNEIKSVRLRSVSILDSYSVCKNLEVYIFNMFIKNYKNSNISFNKINDERRIRKLLLKKSEIKKISKASREKGFIIIPTKVFVKSGKWAKVEIAIAKRKKKYRIKNDQKEKDIKMNIKKGVFSDF